MSGPTLDQLSPAVRVGSDCFCGFWRPDLTATASGDDGQFLVGGTDSSPPGIELWGTGPAELRPGPSLAIVDHGDGSWGDGPPHHCLPRPARGGAGRTAGRGTARVQAGPVRWGPRASSTGRESLSGSLSAGIDNQFQHDPHAGHSHPHRITNPSSVSALQTLEILRPTRILTKDLNHGDTEAQRNRGGEFGESRMRFSHTPSLSKLTRRDSKHKGFPMLVGIKSTEFLLD